ncbi:MAG: hypothetical protein E7315_03975 [Clostridiales bacterium]|nr:hypothetical protein [Clostridiales bacterium]
MPYKFFDIQLFSEETGEALVNTPAQATTESTPATDTGAEFRELIKGKYKEESSKYIQGIINERFKKYKEMEERHELLSPAIEAFAKNKGIDPRDTNALAKMLGEAPDVKAESVDEEALSLERKHRIQQMRENIAQQFKGLEERFPNADIHASLNDPRFVKIMMASDAQTAYRAVHAEEITRDAISQTARLTRQMLVNDILARGMRPQEGSITAYGGGQRKADPSRMTREQRENLERRALRGERITI